MPLVFGWEALVDCGSSSGNRCDVSLFKPLRSGLESAAPLVFSCTEDVAALVRSSWSAVRNKKLIHDSADQ